MTKMLHQLIFLFALFFSVETFASCCSCYPSVDVQTGWRRDNLDWEIKHVGSSYVNAVGKSHINYKDMESYAVTGTARWINSAYYIRLKADWAQSFKGRGIENFKLCSSLFDYDRVSVHTNNPMRRQNEVYDFNAAVGYPFSLFCDRLSFIPLIGFSYHRQRIRIKQPGIHPSHSSYPSHRCLTDEDIANGKTYSDYFSFWEDNSYFFPESYSDSSNPFDRSLSSNPFSSGSSSSRTIAHHLGLKNYRRTQNYRFTWYGFYAGFDAAYALDCTWTLFAEFEGHFLNRCHRKRKSWTGVYFIDHYHNQGYSYGFDGVIGATCAVANDWYLVASTEYKWHHAHSHHHEDTLYWRSVTVQAGLGYMF